MELMEIILAAFDGHMVFLRRLNHKWDIGKHRRVPRRRKHGEIPFDLRKLRLGGVPNRISCKEMVLNTSHSP